MFCYYNVVAIPPTAISRKNLLVFQFFENQPTYFLSSFFPQNTKNKTAVKLTAVSCAPVVEVKIKRPDTKYQLGFSVQNGVVSKKCQMIERNTI